jgi:cell division protein FtsQ
MKRARRNRRKAPRRELPRLPSLPRPRINWRALATLAVVLATGAMSLALGRDLLEFPVKSLEIEGSFQRVSQLEIAAAAEALGKGFLSLDLDAIRQRISGLAWVDQVTLRRIWPDTLRISYTEHRAAARWGETGLLDTTGDLFAEDLRHEYLELPRLDGPEGSHHRVAARYLEVRDGLARAGLTLETLRMDARGAFSIDLAGGLKVRIGRDDIDGRIHRFFTVAVPALVADGDLDRAAYIDMRYPNGFAVGWRKAQSSATQFARLDSHG